VRSVILRNGGATKKGGGTLSQKGRRALFRHNEAEAERRPGVTLPEIQPGEDLSQNLGTRAVGKKGNQHHKKVH